jgi:transcriptional regulator with XRE-family HTH domain
MSADTDRLRALLASLGLSQRAAAALLGMDERTFRRYCSGDLPVPPHLYDRLRANAQQTENGSG